MAEITRINGTTTQGDQIGRDVLFLTFAAANTVMNTVLADVNGVAPVTTNFDLLRTIVDNAATVTMVGLVTGGGDGDDVTFMVEGLGHNDGAGDNAVTDQELINEIRDQVEAINGGAFGTTDCTISTLQGALLTAIVTDN